MKPLSIKLYSLLFSAIVICASVFVTSCGPDDKCHVNVACKNEGVCKNDACICASGYEGVDCNTTSRDRFLGNWLQKGNGISDTIFPVSIVADPASQHVLITNFDNIAGNTVKGILSDGYTIAISASDFRGTIVLTASARMTIEYNVWYSAGNTKNVSTTLTR